MSEEERLQEYMRRNAVEEERQEPPAPPAPTVNPSSTRKTAWSWYFTHATTVFGYTSFFISFFVPMAFLYANSQQGMDASRAMLIGGSVWGTLMLVNTGYYALRLTRFNSWINNRYYKLVGWDDFFAKRTAAYWKENISAPVKMSFNLTDDASDVHRQALAVFTKKMVKNWGKKYQDKDMDWIGKPPADLQTDGQRIYGDLRSGDLRQVVKICAVQFLPLAKLLGNKLKNVTISTSNKETTHSQREEKDEPNFSTRD